MSQFLAEKQTKQRVEVEHYYNNNNDNKHRPSFKFQLSSLNCLFPSCLTFNPHTPFPSTTFILFKHEFLVGCSPSPVLFSEVLLKETVPYHIQTIAPLHYDNRQGHNVILLDILSLFLFTLPLHSTPSLRRWRGHWDPGPDQTKPRSSSLNGNHPRSGNIFRSCPVIILLLSLCTY